MTHYSHPKMIHATVFIEEIKNRPAIYNNSEVVGKEYQERRREAWYDLAKKLITGFDGLSMPKQESFVKEMQARWKSFRDNYRKEVRWQKREEQARLANKPVLRRKKYHLFDRLSFVHPHCYPYGEPKIAAANSCIELAPANQVLATQEVPRSSEVIFSAVASEEMYVKEELLEPKSELMDENEDSSISGFSEARIDFRNNQLNDDVVLMLNQLVANQKVEREDTFGNREFLLSFLPMMNELSKEKNLEVRAKILQAFTE